MEVRGGIVVCTTKGDNFWIKDGHEEISASGGDFPAFLSSGDVVIYRTPSLEFPRQIKIALAEGCYVTVFLGGEFREDVTMGVGFLRHGLKRAPFVRTILADIALGGHADRVELNHFGVGRFEENP
ncbi:hypothetical protein NL676_027370 [Syzygium grande]|nr:hypothetical protein NL676_027370 [Syzygium grande]